ncbi:MAG: hypothetical protein GF392_00295 [Candidatus Omnitrophica bacterium]|nr:hypothetical protein [Candidatus Omnitrophota bacterium]
MFKALIKRNISRTVHSRKGVVLPIVLSFIALMVMSTVTLSNLIKRDIDLVSRARDTEQARFLAEAGIKHGLADIKANGFAARSDFTGSLDTGNYTVEYSQVSGRHLVSSTGTVGSRSVEVSAEIADNTPTALNYFSGAGNDVRIYSFIADAGIIGDIHGNNNVYLMSGFLIAWLDIAGDVSATGIVKEGTRYNNGSWDLLDNHVEINGDSNDSATVYEGEDRITFPTFDYMAYKELAVDSGDYYSTDTEFDSVALTPDNGVVYVDGEATFRGISSITGGIVADQIRIINTLNQYRSGTRNVIMAKNGDIRIFGKLYTEEALVMASQDITSRQLGADIDINGILLAKRNIDMWNFLTYIDYNYVFISPGDMMSEEGESTFELVSWNS